MIRVLVVDDHPLIRESVAALLDTAGGVDVVGRCADGAEAVTAAESLHPDVVLMDVTMPVLDGIAATRELLAVRPGTRVVLLSATMAENSVSAAYAAGAVGYQLKSAGPDCLIEAVRTVGAGGQAWDPRAAEELRHTQHDA